MIDAKEPTERTKETVSIEWDWDMDATTVELGFSDGPFTDWFTPLDALLEGCPSVQRTSPGAFPLASLACAESHQEGFDRRMDIVRHLGIPPGALLCDTAQ